jgi:hypothetical protein
VEEIAKIKMPDLNCFDVEAAMLRLCFVTGASFAPPLQYFLKGEITNEA